MANPRQTNFSGGEFSPLLWGRTDLAKFGVGLRRCRNFFVSKQGAAISRPGTVVVNELKFSGPVRMIPFVYSDTQAYVLEFGHQYIRFHANGGTIEVGGGPYEVVTPYLSTDVKYLRWAQTGDVVTLTHPSYAPMELRRLGHTSWSIAPISFEVAPPYFTDINNPLVATLEPMVLSSDIAGADASHPAREWKWKVTVVAQETATGRIFETMPADVTWSFNGANPAGVLIPLPAEIVLYPDKKITLRRATTAGLISQPAGWDGYKAIAYNYYRGRGDIFGFIGQTKTRDFTDVGEEPDYAIQPPLGKNPFNAYDNVGNLVRVDHPAAVTFFQERRVFGGIILRPGQLLLSATGDYANFDERQVHLAGESLTYELASRKREEIRNLVGLSRLVALTDSSAWSVSGQQGVPIDFNTVDARVIEEIGSNHLPPLVVDGAALYCRSKGVGVRGLVFDQGRDGFTGVDLSLTSQHLFSGRVFGTLGGQTNFEDYASRAVVDWAYAEDPWGMVWAVREDGVLLSLTFSRENEMWAWARHDTDGYVKNVCSVPEGDEDAVYLVVQRTVNISSFLFSSVQRFFIERMASRVRLGGPYDDICVDSAYPYRGPPTQTFSGLTHLANKQVYAIAVGNAPQGPLTVSNAGQVILPEMPTTTFTDNGGNPVLVMHIGQAFTAELETLDTIGGGDGRLRQKTVKRVGLEVDEARGLEVGPDFDQLVPWEQRDVADSYNAVSAATRLVTIDLLGGYNQNARIAIRQPLPLPVSVLGITRELDFGS